jgi:DNA-binding GntR family transcriptional regulator
LIFAKDSHVRSGNPALDPASADSYQDIPSLPKFIYDKIYAAILDGSFRPGQLLRQEELAARFNTSRVPLREALQSLQAKGLVELRPRRGYAVTSLDEHELLGILQLRMLIEGYAGYVATLARVEADINALEVRLRALEKFPAKNMSDAQHVKWVALNRRFHDCLFASARNHQLTQLTSNLSAKVQPYILLDLRSHEDMIHGAAYHREIFEAFKKGDAAAVAVLSRRHCELNAIRFLEVLQSRNVVTDMTHEKIIDLGPAADMARPEQKAVKSNGDVATTSSRKPRPAVSKPGMSKPAISKPAVSKPPVSKPVLSTKVGQRAASKKKAVAS